MSPAPLLRTAQSVPEMNKVATPVDDSELDAFRDGARRFVEREIAPYVAAWDEAGSFPREL
jgi:acyl-CoA dehydrogenase